MDAKKIIKICHKSVFLIVIYGVKLIAAVIRLRRLVTQLQFYEKQQKYNNREEALN